MAHGGADGGRSHGGVMAADSRGPTNGGGAGGGGARGGDGEPTSQGDAEDPGGQGGAECSGDQGEGRAPEIRGGAGATEDPGGAEGRKEPNGAGGTERRGAARGEESWGDGGSMPDQGGAGGTREPGGAGGSMGDGGGEGARSRGGATGSTDRDRVRASEAGGGDEGNSSPVGLAPHWWRAEGEQRGCQTTAVEEAGAGGNFWGAGTGGRSGGRFQGAGTGGHFRGAGTGESEAPSGLDKGTKDEGGLDRNQRDDWEREGAVRSPEQHPSLSDPAPCLAVPDLLTAHPQPRAGAELHSALTPSTACSLVMGTVAGSRTWSDGLGSTSGTIIRSVARLSAGSQITAGNGSPSSVGSGWCSLPRGDGGLGSGSGVDLARSSSGETVRGDPFLTRVHSTKAAKSSRGPSSDDSVVRVAGGVSYT